MKSFGIEICKELKELLKRQWIIYVMIFSQLNFYMAIQFPNFTYMKEITSVLLS